ncbi:MAG TPA: HNH endonuclease [bacterium]
MSVLNTNVLVLNRSFIPVHVTTLRRAFVLFYANIAKAVDKQFRTFDFNSWSQLSVELGEAGVGLVNREIKIPRVILLTTYDRLPKRRIRFSRYNIFARDKNTCQYCGRKFPRNELTIDHVIPRSLGGVTCWDNVVCSCIECNRMKGGRLPEFANMLLITKPKKPAWTPYFGLFLKGAMKYEEWAPFLNFLDAAYWNVELESD